jgi:alpha,alpha-trehalose phosphorylase
MNDHPAFAIEPWAVREPHFNLATLGQTESVFALSNGHFGLRGNLDEGEPYELPGTYLNAFWEVRPLPYAEAGYGYPEAGETIVNMTNGKIIRLLVDDSPFDIRYGELIKHERTLDFRSGMLSREAIWRSPSGKAVRIVSHRLVSFVQRAVAAIHYEVEPLEETTRFVVQSELVTNEPHPPASKDPRAAAALEAPLRCEDAAAHDLQAVLVHTTKGSGLTAAAAMDHVIEGPDGTRFDPIETWDELGRLTVTSTVEPGQKLRLVKFLAYGWSKERSMPAIRDQVSGAVAEARHTGWDSLASAQRKYLDEFWEGADVELDGDAELQQAVRFALFHVLQAGARGEGRAIGAKGLTGSGYDGHCFWDTESYVLPVLSSASRGPFSPGGRSAAPSALPTGRPGPPPSTSTPTSPAPSSATRTPPATSPSNATSGSSCWSKRRGSGAPSATTTRAANSASMGSPGPMSTARSPTTTSTRT